MTFTERFLHAKHWQLFLPIFGIPMIFQFILMGTFIATMSSDTGISVMFNYFKIFPVLTIICLGTIFCWFWSIAIGLQYKVPAHINMKTKRFKVFFFIPLIYLLFISIGIAALGGISGLIKSSDMPDIILIESMMGIIFPLHLFSMFCMFYSLYFVAKTFKTVELQREVTFSDFAGEFFMIWFYPIGIWIIQPKVNKMVEKV
jgi:hypothetical protein